MKQSKFGSTRSVWSAAHSAAFLGCLFLLAAGTCLAQTEILQQASRLEQQGDFKQAAATLSQALKSPSLSATDRKQAEFELDRLERIRKDFPFTEDSLFGALKKAVKNLTRPEFEQWVREGRFDSREIDGSRYFMGSSVANLFFRYPELASRRQPAKDDAAVERHHWELCLAIKEAARAEQKPYVLPQRFRAVMTVTADPDAAPAGQTVRAWLPIPREYPFQRDFELISANPAAQHVNPQDSPIRSILLEQLAKRAQATRFKAEYQYTTYGVWFDIDPSQVKPADLGNPNLKLFTTEAPHIVFTPEIHALSRQIVGDETNPYRIAQKFYDWIADHIQYSFAIEYSTVPNLSDYCLNRRYGDCGQEALLFLTLCRLNGIPARWQSGWNTFPGAKSIHDWTEIYLAPYGWIPVDPYMGIFAMQYSPALTPEQRQQLRDFYFGGLDQYRMIANSDHNQVLDPPKKSMRSDNVDFQRGELEWGTHNIYFDQYSYGLKVNEIKPQARRVE